MKAEMILLPPGTSRKQSPRYSGQKARTFTEDHVHGTTCVHAVDGKLCGAPIGNVEMQGWLCEEHTKRVFR